MNSLERLDQIERLPPSAATDAEVLNLMEGFASTSEKFSELIERYGASLNPTIVRTLSFLLAKAASSSTDNISDLICNLIARLRCLDDDATLINNLTGLQRTLILGHFSKQSCLLVLDRFLMLGLTRSTIVQRGAIAVLALLHRDGFLTEVFSNKRMNLLRKRLSEISAQNDEFLLAEMDDLLEI